MLSYTKIYEAPEGKLYVEGRCRSEDAMPTENILTGSLLTVEDTGKRYMFDEGSLQWYPIPGRDSGGDDEDEGSNPNSVEVYNGTIQYPFGENFSNGEAFLLELKEQFEANEATAFVSIVQPGSTNVAHISLTAVVSDEMNGTFASFSVSVPTQDTQNGMFYVITPTYNPEGITSVVTYIGTWDTDASSIIQIWQPATEFGITGDYPVTVTIIRHPLSGSAPSGGTDLPKLNTPATASDITYGKQAYKDDATVLTGTNRLVDLGTFSFTNNGSLSSDLSDLSDLLSSLVDSGYDTCFVSTGNDNRVTFYTGTPSIANSRRIDAELAILNGYVASNYISGFLFYNDELIGACDLTLDGSETASGYPFNITLNDDFLQDDEAVDDFSMSITIHLAAYLI